MISADRSGRRVAICGGADLAAAVAVLGLTADDERPEIVLLELAHDGAVAAAARIPPDVPRIAVVDAADDALPRALGLGLIARSSDPAEIGPLVATCLPASRARRTRTIAVTSVCGGVGRTMLVANLAARLARGGLGVVALDLTGSGQLAWWLDAEVSSWSELEPIVEELTADHLAIVAVPASAGGHRDPGGHQGAGGHRMERCRVIGGGPVAPSSALATAVLREIDRLGDVVLVDAPIVASAAVAFSEAADRVLVVLRDDPASAAALASCPVSPDAWIIASGSRAAGIGDREVFRCLPHDDAACRLAMRTRSVAGGQLGRAYDDLAELLTLDLTR